VFTIVKDSPANKPFVFETTVSIEHSDIKSDEKARLEGGLYE